MAGIKVITAFFMTFILLVDAADALALSCQDEYEPVCASDQKTYRNYCYALAEFWPNLMPEVLLLGPMVNNYVISYSSHGKFEI